MADEVRRVLSNWIQQAIEPPGHLREGIDPADWIAAHFLAWFRSEAGNAIGDMALATHHVRAELERLGGWANPDLGEAMHGLVHIDDARDELERLLQIEERQEESS
jgi:hypothetical protein